MENTSEVCRELYDLVQRFVQFFISLSSVIPASCTSLIHLRTISGHVTKRRRPAMRADEATKAFLSTMACFKYLSIAPNMAASMIFANTLIEFARYKSSPVFMSFVRELVTMMTSSGLHVSATSLMNKYIMRRRFTSSDWKSLVTPKKTSVISAELKDSPLTSKKRSFVIIKQHFRGFCVTTRASWKTRLSCRTVAFSRC